uniref:UPF0481 protein At3g47200-like n=1 Tax=Erigeron canadensis TaxID=72917 RepID=UPI001CB97A5A|nr:UPF0481 protein At3g47200-like [Erigeron canadensis]
MTKEEGSPSNVSNNEEEIVAKERVSNVPREVADAKQKTIQNTVQSLVDRVKKARNSNRFSSIYTAPSRLRDLNPSLFIPRVVSIGPLHKEKLNLKSTEARKAAFVNELLSEIGFIDETLHNCVQKVYDKIERIRGCYDGMKKTAYNDDEFTQMMVMDACFILQFISKLSGSGNLLSDNRLRSRSIALDLVLLENQIPFFVLEDIYESTINKLQSRPSLITMLSNLLGYINPFTDCIKMDNIGTETTHDHILGLLHKVYLPKLPNSSTISVLPTAHSAVELDKIGVKFRPKDEKIWPLSIDFQSSSHKPTLRMPVVVIDNFFEVVVKNLIVYEQYSPVYNYVTSYAMALDMLVDSPADIAKLGESDVLVNHLGSNEKASDMIKNICKDVTFLDFYYIDSWKRMDTYYDSYWSKCIGVLKQKYFSSPLTAVGLLAGIIIFIVTVVQLPFQIKQS